MKRRAPSLTTTPKRRARNVPRSEKIIRAWEADGWAYELAQRPTGDFALYAVDLASDEWRISSAPTIKGALATIAQQDAESLLSVAE